MKPKILYILPEYNIHASSHHVHVFEMLEELGKNLDIFLLVERSVGSPKIKNLSQVYVQKINLPVFNLIERCFMICWIRYQGFEKAYIHYSYWGAILSALIFRPSGGKVFYWHCEVYDHFFSPWKFNSSSFRKKILDEWLMVVTLRVVNYLVTATPKVAKFYQETFNLDDDKIRIIPNWINLLRFKHTGKISKEKLLHITKLRPVVLFVHRLVARKGADLLPMIVSKVKTTLPSALFVIVGDGPLRLQIEKNIEKLDLSYNCLLVGAIPNDRVKEYFHVSNLFIMPSRQEGFPRVLLEAMATKLPFVATGVGGVYDIITRKQRTHIVPPGRADLISKGVVNLLNNPRLKRELIREGEAQVRKFDIKVVAKMFIHLLA